MSSYKPLDEVGKLVLLKRIVHKGRDSKGRAAWECECKCGRKVVRREDYLASGKAVSCGCTNAGQWKTGDKCRHWTGHELINGQYWSSIRCGAIKRKIQFEVTIEEAWQKFVQQEGKCALSGLPLCFYGFRDRKRGLQQTASLDRIDALKGYTVINVQWVHKDVNAMKKEYPQERFLEICRLVTINQQAKSETQESP